MRLVIDTLIALMLVLVLAGTLLYHRQETEQSVSLQRVQMALGELQARTILHGALGETEVNEWGFPTQVSPLWFEQDIPVNHLVPASHPWIDFAPTGDYSQHPPDPVITRPQQAGFWYNPARGIFRARVLPQLSEGRTLEMYNQINGTRLSELPHDRSEKRRPIPYVGQPPRVPTEQVAERSLPDSGATVMINPRAAAASPVNDTSATAQADPASRRDADRATDKAELTPRQRVVTDAFGRPIQLDLTGRHGQPDTSH